MHRNRLLFLALAMSAFGVSAMETKLVTAETTAASRPNILFFYVDDMGWGSIGPNGQAARRAKNLPSVCTPNLDRLAAEGLNFTRGYGCHVCSPARSSLQTGFHQGHTFADRNDPNNARKAIRADDISIGRALSNAGYVNGYWGKWGYGGSKTMANPVIENVQTLPTSHGYQFVLAELHHVRAHTFFQPTLWQAPSADTRSSLQLVPNSMAHYRNHAAGDTAARSYPKEPALQDHPEYPEIAYCDDAYAFAALDFVRTQGQNYNKTGQPFHGLLAVQIPHAPFHEVATLPAWDTAYADDPHFASLAAQSQQWAAMVTRIDAHFGNILAALEDPNSDGDTSDSIADNTLVVFQSDNGGPNGRSNVEFDANGGLRGSKGKIQEGGIRVPLVMRWPAKIHDSSKLRPGTNCDMVVDVTDLLPTFCELAGAVVPLGIDGVSLAPTLLGNGQQRTREFIIHEASNGQSIIRDNFKLVRSKRKLLQLFNLTDDPAESSDVAAKHPQLVKELETLLLGERVAEPKGFANTYHRWTGGDHGVTSDPENWSDYEYANAGITYMKDDGAPQASWIAKIENTRESPRTARVDKDLTMLGLEVRGSAKGSQQTVVLGPNVNVLGRNEVRLAPHSTVTLDGGSVSTLRWIDVQPNATIDGHGILQGDVYNSGTVAVRVGKQPSIQLDGNYHQSSNGTLRLSLLGHEKAKPDKAAFRVKGEVQLDGILALEKLALDIAHSKTQSGKSITVIAADRVVGRFANSDDEIVAADGARFTVDYSKSAVSIRVK